MSRALMISIAATFATLGGCSDRAEERAPEVRAAPVIRQAPSPAGQDRYTDAQTRAERRERGAMPALQDLPYSDGGVRIELVDVAPNGRLVVKVTATGEGQARRAYRTWLARSGDSGRSFEPLYRWTAGHRAKGSRG